MRPRSDEAIDMKDADKKKQQLVRELAEARSAVRQAKRRVKKQEDFVRTIIESISFPFYIIDANTYRFVMANPAAYGIRFSEDATCYAVTHRRSSPCEGLDACPLEQVKKTKQPTIVEHVHYDRYGMPRYFEVHAFPILDKKGEVAQMIEYNIDISDRVRSEERQKRHQKSLELLVAELERSNRELREFASVAAHDIRSPMSKISSSAALLRDILGDTLNDEQRKMFDILTRGVERTAQMITSLNRFAQLEGGQVRMTSVDLNKLVHEVTSFQLATEIERSGGSVRVIERLHVVQGDELQLLAVVQNLIGNALKYHRDGLPPEVTVRSMDIDEERVVLEVEDNGIGIKESDRKRIFGMMQRIQEGSADDGLGIGLALCKNIVERHGGRIGVNSLYGSGSVFWVELLKADPAPQRVASQYVEETR